MINKMKLQKIYGELQEVMLANLKLNKATIENSVAKGTATENDWLDWMREYLPKRYKVDSAFIIDCNGNMSEQIDIVIYDAHYSPLVFNKSGTKYITAESVYAVFEVKQVLNRENVNYAASKAKSVRRLYRTSADVVYSDRIVKGKKPAKIFAGLLTTTCDWKTNIEGKVIDIVKSLNSDKFLDLICCIDYGTFITDEEDYNGIKVSNNNETLILFYFILLKKLQSVGTVTAIDFNKYIKCLDNE